jgi:RNA polymerase sigma-B factor
LILATTAQEQRLQEDRVLFERFQDRHDPVDRETLVERFLPLARSLATRYTARGEPFDDIFQVASLALVKAIDRFDASRGGAFSSYAVPTIVGEIKRHFRDRTWAVHVPRDLQELALRVDKAAGELEGELHRKPTVPDLAERLELSDEEVLEALQVTRAYRLTSLDAPRDEADEDRVTVGATIGTDDDGFHHAEIRATLRNLSVILTPRERLVLHLRYDRDLTQREIGERVGISQMQISRILRRAIEKLRSYAGATELALAHPSS